MSGMARMSNGVVEVGVPDWCGPRVLHFGAVGGPNVLGAASAAFTETSLGRWHPMGGHRLWVAPESMPGSYAPDDRPVELVSPGPLTRTLRAAPDATGIEKQIDLELLPDAPVMVVRHRIVNRTYWPILAAPWAITIVDPAGTAILPQPPHRTHAEQLLPSRTIVQWAYTDFTDSRWHIGRHLVRLTPDQHKPSAQKIGIANEAGWSAVLHGTQAFFKLAAWKPDARYPDLGSHTEVFTAGAYLELETLGALSLIEPGASSGHTEVWMVVDVPQPLSDEAALAEWCASTAEHGRGALDP